MSLTPASALTKDRTQLSGSAVFQHRHYAEIASILRDLPEQGNRIDIIEHFADRLARSNLNFDRKRFLAACDPSAGW